MSSNNIYLKYKSLRKWLSPYWLINHGDLCQNRTPRRFSGSLSGRNMCASEHFRYIVHKFVADANIISSKDYLCLLRGCWLDNSAVSAIAIHDINCEGMVLLET